MNSLNGAALYSLNSLNACHPYGQNDQGSYDFTHWPGPQQSVGYGFALVGVPQNAMANSGVNLVFSIGGTLGAPTVSKEVRANIQ
jgi:hypothetical protein